MTQFLLKAHADKFIRSFNFFPMNFLIQKDDFCDPNQPGTLKREYHKKTPEQWAEILENNPKIQRVLGEIVGAKNYALESFTNEVTLGMCHGGSEKPHKFLPFTNAVSDEDVYKQLYAYLGEHMLNVTHIVLDDGI